jgi:hypothetical protein
MNTRKKRSPEETESELEELLRDRRVALTDPEVVALLYDSFPVDHDDSCF